LRLQAGHHRQPPAIGDIEHAVHAALQRLAAEGCGDAERRADVGPQEAGRRDADDGERLIAERQPAADDGRRRAIAIAPEGVTDDDDRAIGPTATAHIIGACQQASQPRAHPERVEEAAADPHPIDRASLATGVLVEAGGVEGEGAVEEIAVMIAQRLPDRVGEIAPDVLAIRRQADLHQPFRIGHRQRLQHHRVDDGEDRSVGTDPQREREDRDRREHRRGPQHTQAVADIGAELLE
jgi:hypothetical protein